MYHFFGDAPAHGDPKGLFVSEQALADQLGWLGRRGWNPLTLTEFLAALDGAPTPRRSYLFTIDDGHESAMRIAAPALAAAGVPSVLFVPSGLLGGPPSWTEDYASERLLDASELRSVAATGMEIGVHGFDHTRMWDMTPEELERSTVHARRVLSDAGIEARSYAYPYGTWDGPARRAVAGSGYDAAFAVAREGGRFALDRVGVYAHDSMLTFRLKLSFPYRVVLRIAGRTWRLRHLVRDALAAARPHTRVGRRVDA